MQNKRSLLNKLLLLCFALLPLAHGSVFSNQHLPKIGLLTVVVALPIAFFVAKALRKKGFWVDGSPLILWWGLFAFFALAACWQCIDKSSALARLSYWWTLLALFLWARTAEKNFLARCLLVLSIAATLSAVYGLAQSFYLKPVHGYVAYASTFGNVNFAASFSAVMLPAVLALWWKRGYQGLLRFCAAAIIVFYLLRTGSRAAWIGMTLALFVYASLVLGYSRKKIARRKLLLTFFGICVILAIPAAIPSWRQQVQGQLTSLADWEHGSVKVRIDIWSASWKMYQDHPWLGIGPGQFMHCFYRYRLVGEYLLSEGRLAKHPHNTGLLILLETGIVGALCFALAVLYTTILLIRGVRTPESDFATLSAFISGLTALMVIGLFSCPLLSPASAIFLPLASAYSERWAKNFRYELKISRWAVMIGSVVVAFVLSMVAARRLVADISFTRGEQSMLRSEWCIAQKQLEEALNWYPNPMYQIEHARALVAAGDYSRAAKAFTNALKKAPGLEAGYIDLGLCYLKQGKRSEAIVAWRKACSLFPASLIARYNLAKALIEMHQEREAILELHKLASFYPSYRQNFDYQMLLGRCYRERGKKKQALIHYAAAKKLNSDNIVSYLQITLLIPPMAPTYYALGQLLSQGKAKDAREYLLRLCALYPRYRYDFRYYLTLGLCYQVSGDYTQALVCAVAAAKLSPNHPLPYVQTILLMPRANDEKTLLTSFQRAGLLVEQPESVCDYLAWGVYRQARGQMEQAWIQYYNPALQIAPQNPIPHLYSALAVFSLAIRQNDDILYNRAFTSLANALDIKDSPHRFLVYFCAGEMLEQRGQAFRAGIFFRKATSSPWLAAAAHLRLAQISLRLGEADKTRNCLKNAQVAGFFDWRRLPNEAQFKLLTTSEIYRKFSCKLGAKSCNRRSGKR